MYIATAYLNEIITKSSQDYHLIILCMGIYTHIHMSNNFLDTLEKIYTYVTIHVYLPGHIIKHLV